MQSPAETVAKSVEELDKLLSEGHRPQGSEGATKSLESRFLEASPVHSRLRHLKQLYGAHPSIEERFNYRKYLHSTNADTLANMRSYHRVLAQMAASLKTPQFAQGGLKRFLDLGCSPGGFSNWLLENNKDARGIGITLPDEEARWAMVVEGTELEGQRYELRFADLISLVNASIAKGENPTTSANTDSGLSLESKLIPFDLVIAGAFPTLAEGRVSTRYRIQLALSQLLILFCSLRRGGDAIIVTNTKTKGWIVEITALLRRCFSAIAAGKGSYLHAERSSCYLVCTDFCATDDQIADSIQILKNALARVGGVEDKQPVLDREGCEEIDEGEKWRELLQFSNWTVEELFEAEHRFLLDLFEPVWQKQHDAIYNSFVRMLNREGNKKRPPRVAPGSEDPSRSLSVLMPESPSGVHTHGGDGWVPEWRRLAGSLYISDDAHTPSDTISPRDVTGSLNARPGFATRYVVPARRASVSEQPADGTSSWRNRTSPSGSFFTRPRGATIADTNSTWRSKAGSKLQTRDADI